ncbi:MAG: metallophosphoesterase [Crocinitomicaceae bacterium]|nr:metallophosphoesterase [Crocinitomicaceae bacterium]
MNRRSFLKNTTIISGGVVIAPSLISAQSGWENEDDHLTILHTNDTHSNIEPFPENHSRYAGKGGVANRFDMIQRIRKEEKNVLLLDAGDIFQGTPYFNKFGGVLEMKLMSYLGYDAGTMGNHDFDAGLEGFVRAQEYAKFPFLCSNYDFKNTPIYGLTEDTLVIQKGNIKVGLFGLGVELDGLVPSLKFGETKYLDPIEVAKDKAKELKEKGCDLIICLSHLGYDFNDDQVSDLILAKKTKDIHLIIGGHTHTFLDKPTETKNSVGETVLINQVGWAGINLGRIDFEFKKRSFSKKEKLVIQ